MALAETYDQPVLAASEDAAGVLKGRYAISIQEPLQNLDRGENKAYKANDNQNPANAIYAVISSPFLPYRSEFALELNTSHMPGLLDLVDYGSVRFGETDIRYVFIFQMPAGGLVFRENEGPIPERVILESIVPFIISTLTTLDRHGHAHRGIRADNFFYADESRLEFILGESVTTPAGSDQPAVYEPLESANAHIYGRGNGSLDFDIYAFGVLILHLLTGKLPCQGLSEEDLYLRKLEQGSFTLLTAGLHLSPRTNLLLTGLLQDDPNRRWNLEMLGRWREIMNDQIKPSWGDKRGLGAILFKGQEYDAPRLLAHALIQHPKEAGELLERDKLVTWVRSALRDPDSAEQIARISTASSKEARGHRRNDITTVAQINRYLDPYGSFWYRNVRFAWGGLGGVLAYAFMKDPPGVKTALGELLENGILVNLATNDQDWSPIQRRGWLSYSSASECFEIMKKKEQFGYGLERCLYELNPNLACLSPNLSGSNIKTLSQLIVIMEKKLLSSGGKMNPFDRHTAAFIVTKSNGLKKYFAQMALAKQGDVSHTLSLLKMFAYLQNTYHPSALPGFSHWAETLLVPLIGKMQSRLRREFVKQRFEAAKKSGNIGAILNAIDIERQVKLDNHEYSQAINQLLHAERLAEYLQKDVESRKFAASQYGQWITSIVSITALATSMVLSGLYFLK